MPTLSCWERVLTSLAQWMTYLPDALQVSLSSPITGAIVPAAAGSSPSDGGGAELLSKRAPPWSFLLASTRYVCGVESYGMLFPLPAFQILGFEGSVGLNGRSHTLLAPVIHRQPAVWWHCLRSYWMQVVLLEASLVSRCLVPASPDERPGWCGLSPWVHGCHAPAVAQTVSTWFFRLRIPACQLEAGGEQRRASVLTGCYRRVVAPPNTGLYPPQHSSPDLGQS
jgi:hypothetical protein